MLERAPGPLFFNPPRQQFSHFARFCMADREGVQTLDPRSLRSSSFEGHSVLSTVVFSVRSGRFPSETPLLLSFSLSPFFWVFFKSKGVYCDFRSSEKRKCVNACDRCQTTPPSGQPLLPCKCHAHFGFPSGDTHSMLSFRSFCRTRHPKL